MKTSFTLESFKKKGSSFVNMLQKKKRASRRQDFLIENSHYRRLHLYLYFMSLIVLLGVYFVIIILFSDSSYKLVISLIASLFLGLYLVFKRDKMVKKLSEYIQERKRKKLKEDNKSGLNTTLKRITPKNKSLKLKVGQRFSLKAKIIELTKKLQKEPKNKKKGPDYIEIE